MYKTLRRRSSNCTVITAFILLKHANADCLTKLITSRINQLNIIARFNKLLLQTLVPGANCFVASLAFILILMYFLYTCCFPALSYATCTCITRTSVWRRSLTNINSSFTCGICILLLLLAYSYDVCKKLITFCRDIILFNFKKGIRNWFLVTQISNYFIIANSSQCMRKLSQQSSS